MIFSELYGAYYNAVAAIISEAVKHPVDRSDIRRIVGEKAFGESLLNIEPSLLEGKWQLLRKDGTTPLRHEPTMPLTRLEKSWLMAISADPRVKLFGCPVFDFPDTEPLFSREDIYVFDRYADGDDYGDEKYIAHFRLILDAIRNRYPVTIETLNRRGNGIKVNMQPEQLEYSEKDDKFRVIGSGDRRGGTINLGRIISCERCPVDIKPDNFVPVPEVRKVVFELTDERNALERVLMHFAHFEKQAERIDKKKYIVTVSYDRDDETEMLIRILSFGPVIKVTSPDSFIGLIRERLRKQKALGL